MKPIAEKLKFDKNNLVNGVHPPFLSAFYYKYCTNYIPDQSISTAIWVDFSNFNISRYFCIFYEQTE